MHAPITYFPLMVEEALMIEPTESYEREEVDRFVKIMKKVSEEAYANSHAVLEAPQNTAIPRLDEVRASPKTMALSWKMHLKRTRP